jgi:anti-anti-sigma factor
VNALRIEIERSDGRTVVAVAGEIDLATREQLRDSLNRLDGVVIVDLTDVTFLDSSGIGVLASQRARLIKNSGELILRNPHPNVRTPLTTVGLDLLIED